MLAKHYSRKKLATILVTILTLFTYYSTKKKQSQQCVVVEVNVRAIVICDVISTQARSESNYFKDSSSPPLRPAASRPALEGPALPGRDHPARQYRLAAEAELPRDAPLHAQVQQEQRRGGH